MKTALFRKEVYEKRQQQWLGTVLLVPTLSHRAFGIFAVVATVAIVALLVFGEYPRKAHVAGWLVPEAGLVQVFAPQSGVISEMFVKEGTAVKKGDRLLAVSGDLESRAVGATASEVVARLKQRRESLLKERGALEQLEKQQGESLAARVSALESAESMAASELSLQRSLRVSAERTVTRARALEKEGLASAQQRQNAEDALLGQRAKLNELERSRLGSQQAKILAQGDLRDLPVRLQSDIANVEQAIAGVEQQLAEAEARREAVVTAPADGTVSALQAQLGARPDAKAPVISIVPEGSKLNALVYAPSSAVGFLRVGQRVLLRYAPYPYQKFGHHEGTVASISRSAVTPTELPAGMAGVTALSNTADPLYRVTVSLTSQTITAYGSPTPLQPGMQFDADVVLERRRLIEWMLEPLFTISGTWKR